MPPKTSQSSATVPSAETPSLVLDGDPSPKPARPAAESADLVDSTARTKARHKLIARLDEERAPDLADRLRSCEEPYNLLCTCCGSRKTVQTHCRARYCPSCQPIVSAERWTRWQKPCSLIRWPLFVTLTVPNSLDPESVRTLKKRWSQFRRRKLIREKVRGGIATFEVTSKGKGWHPHLHALMDCRWLSLDVPEPTKSDSPDVVSQKLTLAQRELSALWAEQIREPEAVVWVRRASGKQAVSEILKYAVKTSDLIDSPIAIAPMLRILSKSRMLAGWGSLHPLPTPDDDQQPAVACPDCQAEKSYMPEAVVSYLLGPAGHDNRPAIPYNSRA